MKVEILNQYRAIVKVNEEKQSTVYRTHLTLDDLKKRIYDDINHVDRLIVNDAEWIYDGPVACTLGFVQNSFGDINRVKSFNSKRPKRTMLEWHTLDEIMKHDLVYIQDYGVLQDEDRKTFSNKFRELAAKK